MPYLDPEKRRQYGKQWQTKFRNRVSNGKVEGRLCVCSRPAVKIVDNQPVCKFCLEIDAKTHTWDPELKYGIDGRVEAARPTRKHYYQKTVHFERSWA